jgi:serine/threonine-protein kinase
MLLLSIMPATAGRTGPLKFAVAMVGPSLDEARNVVEQVVSQVQGLTPDSLDLAASLAKAEPGQPIDSLLDE